MAATVLSPSHDCQFELRLDGPQRDGGTYDLFARTDDGCEIDAEFRFGDDERAELLASEADIVGYGTRLGNMIFPSTVKAAYQSAAGRANERGAKLHVRLVIDQRCPELLVIYWERLHIEIEGRVTAISCAPELPFSRYTSLPTREPAAVTERPLRLLVAVANPLNLPAGLVAIDVESEIRSLTESLSGFADDLRVTIMPGRTSLPAAFQAELLQKNYRVLTGACTRGKLGEQLARQQMHMVHFLGHGFFNRVKNIASLFIEDASGSADVIPDFEFVELLSNLTPLPQLVFLAACESATRSDDDPHPFIGLGPKLVQAGFPAVVAMQAKVPVEMATKLTANFYRSVLMNGEVDVALNESRAFLLSRKHADWAIPVLFTRLRTGRAFAADPVRLALRNMAAAEAFPAPPVQLPEPLPLEGTVLDAGSIDDTWDHVAMRSQGRVDLWQELTCRLDAAIGKPVRYFLILGAERGYSKSGTLVRLVGQTAQDSLSDGDPDRIIPIYADLQRFGKTRSRSFALSALEALILESLQAFWPVELSEAQFLSMLETMTFRIVLDNGDDLPQVIRADLVQQVRSLIDRRPKHQYVLSIEPGCWDMRHLGASVLMAVRPLSQSRVERYLRCTRLKWATDLADALVTARLFDIASMPWLLMRMMGQAQRGIYPASRVRVLQDVVENEIRKIPPERGQQSRAPQSLYALAFRMQSDQVVSLAIPDAFEILARVRGNREYNLEELLDCLVDTGLLKRDYQEAIRFGYPSYQAYCCACELCASDQKEARDQIVATLGDVAHLRWWEDTLVLLSGMLARPAPLLESIIHGGSLREGDRVMVAARCIQEAGLSPEQADLPGEVFDALLWRADSENEKNAFHRLLAVRLLGQLQNPLIVPYLVRIAVEKVRRTWHGDRDYEYGQIRQSAGRALRRMLKTSASDIEAAHLNLTTILQFWNDENIPELARILALSDDQLATEQLDPALRAMAGFALSDVPSPDDSAAQALLRSFCDPSIDLDTRWVITDALTLVDSEVVLKGIMPLLTQDHSDWFDPLVYLIGQTRTSNPNACGFVEGFLENAAASYQTQGRAIAALGALRMPAWRERFENIVLGDLSSIAGGAGRDQDESSYLRRKALEALAEVGTRDTIKRLRAGRRSWSGDQDLERIFHSTREEIFWRTRDFNTLTFD